MNNTTTPTPPSIQDHTVDHTEDIESIRQIITGIEAWMNGDELDLAVRHFAANATAVSVGGAHITGREALIEAHRRAFATFKRDEYVRYELTDITFLAPDIAIAHKHARVADADGNITNPEPAMIALYVLAKRDGQWWIAARQNTLVAPPSTSAA